MKKNTYFKRTSIIALCLLVLTNLTTLRVNAQVTIGSNAPPLPGALLSLTEGSTTLKGLGLPRVNLTNLTPTTDANLAASIGGTGNYEKKSHIGLLVYNVKENLCVTPKIYKGIHIWNGINWDLLNPTKTEGLEIVVDKRDNEMYYAKKFGNAGDWMLENMRYYHPSMTMSQVSDTPLTASNDLLKRYMYPTGTTANTWGNPPAGWMKKYGLLYTYSAATMGAQDAVSANQGEGQSGEGTLTTPIQGVCPNGWHIPSDREWNDLEEEVYNNPEKYSSIPNSSSFSPATWQVTWNTTYTGPNWEWRGSSNGLGHTHAMVSECESFGKSEDSTKGGFDLFTLGYGEKGVIYPGSAILWASSANPKRYEEVREAWSRAFSSDSRAGRSPSFRTYLFSVRCKKN